MSIRYKMPTNRKRETLPPSPPLLPILRRTCAPSPLRPADRIRAVPERRPRKSEAEASNKRAARAFALPHHTQALALERLLERIRRHGVSQLGERRVVDFL